MFSGHNNVNNDSNDYDLEKYENAAKWKGLFAPALKKVLEQVHNGLSARDDALYYVESLCLRLMALLCAKPPPHTIQDIEARVLKTFPKPIDKWALKDAHEAIDKSKKKKLVFPADRVHSMLQKEVLQYKIDSSVTLFFTAVLEYVAADIFNLAGNYVKNIKHIEISREDIEVAMCADKVLMDMFYQGDDNNIIISSPLPPIPRARLSYEEVVKELIHEEKQYQRDLHMIIRVFREELVKIVRDQKELEPIFSNIFDIYEVTVTLLGSLEDVIEIAEEQSPPCVGSCFEDIAEAAEFDVYIKYAREVTSQQSRDALNNLLAKPDANSLISAGHGFREAVKYYLPKLLLQPIFHAFLYLDYIENLMKLSPTHDDRESFKQVQGLLKPLQCDLESIVATLPNGYYKECAVRMHSRARRQLAIEKTSDLQTTVEHWNKDVGQCCNEFIREDTLAKLGSGKRITERKVYLFDGLIILCKTITRRQTVSVGSNTQQYDFKLKERFFMRRVEIIDRQDTDELKHAFEISPRTQPAVVLIAKNAQHKNDWMADLIMVNTKSMLDRILDSILLDIEKKHPLRLPSPDIYKFSVPDSPNNIVLEERESTGVPLIKGALLCKLIERLTYHIYAAPMFVRTFLTTYRYFCTPTELLELLFERFDIPDPSLVYQDTNNTDNNMETDKLHKNSQREDWKRYKKEYVQPVQFRVLNVLRHWVDHHFYDFEKEPILLSKLMNFLENVNGKSMRKWVDSVLKIVQRKKEQEESHKQITYAFGHSPPPIEHHLNVPKTEFNLLTLHPLELARQLTLLEFELYKNVKPSELVGSPFTKKDKETKSPNLLKIMKHTTNVTRWIEKSIIEMDNYEERVAMVSRAIEVMMVMLELNNFNGIISINAAMKSASVYRLQHTYQGLPAQYKKVLSDCGELNGDGHLKKYQEKLRSINPPCVPFFGRYLTNLLHLEEGNPDFLPNTELINFSKRRKVAEIIGEIQQYQNQPYCLKIDPDIREFLENLDPFQGMTDTEISNYLYEESLRIEPKRCKAPPKFQRKWPDLNLKSPGIKPRRQNNSNNNNSNNSNNNNNNISTSIIPPITFGQKTSLPSSSIHHHHQTNTNNIIGGAAAHHHNNILSNNSEGEQSPTSGITITNPQDFSVFGTVNIPGRNISGSSNLTYNHHHPHLPHNQSHQHIGNTISNSNINLNTTAISPGNNSVGAIGGISPNNDFYNMDNISLTTNANNGCAPELPKRSNSIISINNTAPIDMKRILSPNSTSKSVSGGISCSNSRYFLGMSSATVTTNSNDRDNNSGNFYGGSPHSVMTPNSSETSPPPPISPHHHQQFNTSASSSTIISPRTDFINNTNFNNRSPFPNTNHNNRITGIHIRNSSYSFSPNDDLVSSNNLHLASNEHHHHSQHTTSSSQADLNHIGGQTTTDCGPVPISPHVNVPTTHHNSNPPPPLPPRRQDRKKNGRPPGVAHLAQKRQAPDAPQLPPRDGDPSPPPLPPRQNNFQQYPHSYQTMHHSHHHHRQNQQQQHQAPLPPHSASASMIINRNPTITFDSPPVHDLVMGLNNLMLPHSSTLMIRRNSAMERAAKSLSATSSSSSSSSIGGGASTIPLTATTTIPTATIATTNLGTKSNKAISPASSSSTTVSPMTPISPHLMSSGGTSTTLITHTIHSSGISGITASSTTNTSNALLNNPPPLIVTSSSICRRASTSSNSPRYSPCESTPKLPPKPRFTGNCYNSNNSDKITMFPYPSINHE